VSNHRAGASPFGVMDMAGNVWEWTSSRYCSYSSNNCAGIARVIRGGSWYEGLAWLVSPTVRGGHVPSSETSTVGFRCARDVQ
jgi:formylglycine-generating enzyme required for sulfatase activity